ncbi:unnamed protein product, partial [Rotaria sp. Silwood1]
YCSNFQEYLNERERLRMALLLNKYPNKFVEKQLEDVLIKLAINEPLTISNYNMIRQKVINSPIKEKVPTNYGRTMFVHFTYFSSMKIFPVEFYELWNKYFGESTINEITPILGT